MWNEAEREESMVIFFNKYTENTKKFQETMRCLETDVTIVVLEANGFLPDGVLSPYYEYYISRQNQEKYVKKALYYKDLKVPEFWEIRSSGVIGEICYMGHRRAAIYFAEPSEEKNVQRVEWCSENGWVYRIDSYDQYGLKFASEFLDRDGNTESRVLYSDKNQEVLAEQPGNDAVSLLEYGQVQAFVSSRADFVAHYLAEAGLAGEYALFIQSEKELERLKEKPVIQKVQRVWFSNDELLGKYAGMGGKNGCRFYAIPEKYPPNEAKGEALILTWSDQIEGIEELAQELPYVNFHIAAHTKMSDRLHGLAKRENIKLYPGVSQTALEDLWNRCDFYFDINHYSEVYDAVDTAHLKNLLIMGFENTLHRRELVAEECVFSRENIQKFTLAINELVNHTEVMEGRLMKQQEKKRSMHGAV